MLAADNFPQAHKYIFVTIDFVPWQKTYVVLFLINIPARAITTIFYTLSFSNSYIYIIWFWQTSIRNETDYLALSKNAAQTRLSAYDWKAHNIKACERENLCGNKKNMLQLFFALVSLPPALYVVRNFKILPFVVII